MDAARGRTLVQVMGEVEALATPVSVLLVGEGQLLADTREAIQAIGGRVASEVDWQVFLGNMANHGDPSVIALDARGMDEGLLATALDRVDALVGANGPSAIFSFDRNSLDLVATALMEKPIQLLCEPTRADSAMALAIAARKLDQSAISDTTAYEGEAARLKRLNEEVARIADVLSRLTRREADERRIGVDVQERSHGFEAPPIEEIAIDPNEIRRAIRARRMRDHHFGAGLFEEPGWDMILDLFAAELERTRVSVSSLCIAAAVAPTTALRWISKLTDAGLFSREPDPFDRRRAYMELSERASRAMREYVASLRRAGLSLA